MNLKELDSFKLSDAISFHDELNPQLWDGQELKPEVKHQLILIAKDFLEELGVDDLDVVDVTVSGSNAAYSYTPHSDLDLHILVDLSKMDNDEIYSELFNAKKTLYNDTHDITIHGVPVELYVQDAREPVVSLGEYSILHNKWLRIPTKRRANLDQTATKQKYDKLHKVITKTLQSKNILQVNKVLKKIKQYRQAGLDKGGEFGPENLAYKILRSQGLISKLYKLRDKLHSEHLTIDEVRYIKPISQSVPIQKTQVYPKQNTYIPPEKKTTPAAIIDIKKKVDEVVNPKIFNDIENSLPMFGTKPVQLGDYLYDVRTFRSDVVYDYAPGIQVRAYDPNLPKGHGSIGSADFILQQDEKGDQWLASIDTKVNKEYQGKGVAKHMYFFVKSLGNSIRPTLSRSMAGVKMWDKWHDAEHLMKEQAAAIIDIKKQGVTENTSDIKSSKDILKYINSVHPEALTKEIANVVLSYPNWKLSRVNLHDLHIPDQDYDDPDQEPIEDPYNRVMVIDPSHASEVSAHFIDKRPIVIDHNGYIIDGNHRAWAAAELYGKDTILAWVPITKNLMKEQAAAIIDIKKQNNLEETLLPEIAENLKEFAPTYNHNDDHDERGEKIYKLLQIAIGAATEENIGSMDLHHALDAIANFEFFRLAVKKLLPDITEEEYFWILETAYNTVRDGLREELLPEKINPETLKDKFSQTKSINNGEYTLTAKTDHYGYKGETYPNLEIRLYNHDKKIIGFVMFTVKYREEDNEPYLTSMSTSVDPEYRGRGLARIMYQYANELGNDILPSRIQTKMGRDMWKGLSKTVRKPPPLIKPEIQKPEPKPSLWQRLQKALAEETLDESSQFVYHVTPTKNLKSIAKQGLKPTVGDRTSQISGEKSGIYVFPDKVSAEDAVMNWLGDEFDDEPLTMLKIDVSGLEKNITKGADYELIVGTTIEPSRIKKLNVQLESQF